MPSASTSLSTKEKVLITGANGFIGYATVVKVLAAGFKVVAAVRRLDAKEHVLRGVSVQPFYASGDLEIHIIPDMTVQDAFVQAAQGCSYILHIANPLASVPGDLYTPAVKSMEALIYAAEQTAPVRRIVWTGSLMGNIPYPRMWKSHPDNIAVAEGRDENVAPLTGDSCTEDPEPVPLDGPGMQRYSHGKIVAMNRLRRYAETQGASQHFDIVATVPGWVLGPSELPQSQREAFDGLSTNSLLLFMFTPLYRINAFIGVPEGEAAPLLGSTLHIDDCAEAHVMAMTVPLKGKKMKSYLLCSNGTYGSKYGDAIEIVKRKFPAVATKMIPNAHFSTITPKHDASAAEKELLGRPFKSYERTVIDTIGWFSSLPE